MKLRMWIAALASLALAACIAPDATEPVSAPPLVEAPAAAGAPVVKEAYDPALSTDPIACKDKGGEIQGVCMRNAPMCVITFKDAGKSCTDSDQCQGRCLTNGSPPNQPATGACTPTNNPCGCFQMVNKGLAGYPLCAD